MKSFKVSIEQENNNKTRVDKEDKEERTCKPKVYKKNVCKW
jgi:hypothetical protein